MPATKAAQRRDVAAEIAYLTRVLKAPTLRESAPRLAERAHAENWSHEEYLVACLQPDYYKALTRSASNNCRRTVFRSRHSAAPRRGKSPTGSL